MNNARKIVFLITEDWYFCSHRLPIARAARDAGFDVIIATHVNDCGARITAEGFKLIPIGLRRSTRNPIKEICSIIELIRVYRSETPDIVHQVGMKPVLYGTIAARLAGIPAIINALAGLGYIFISNHWLSKALRFFIKYALQVCLSNRNIRLIIQNPDDVQLLKNLKIVKRDNITLIKGSGVNLSEFKPTPEFPGVTLIVLVSRMLWDKGVKEFVDAARLLIQKDTAARFALIGKNDPDNPSSIPTSTLYSWQQQKIIEYWGYRNDIPDIFQKSHIVCLPSYREGLPKVLIEAAASGRPIITTDTPGCREIVRNGENGYLVPVRNVEALADAMLKLINNPHLRNEMGMKGREIAIKEFSEEKVVNETMTLYRRAS